MLLSYLLSHKYLRIHASVGPHLTMISLSNYTISEQLYQSANSIVYRGLRRDDKSPVILKVLRVQAPPQVAWFKREYDITRSLPTAAVAQGYGLEHSGNLWVMVLEDFGGESLSRLQLAGNLTLDEFLKLAIDVSLSLGQVHQQQVIHKDINPSNIVLNPETGQVKLIDFGSSSMSSGVKPDEPQWLEGTLPYISPEQTGRMNRPIDYRTDFYSLGVTFYELLTGQLPFGTLDEQDDEARSLSLVHAHLAKEAIPPHDINPLVPPIVSRIVMKLMAKNADERYQSAYGLQADLERCLEQVQGTPHLPRTFTFQLGQNDFSGQFQHKALWVKLYGRSEEIATLLAASERVSEANDTRTDEGARELMLVAGDSGVGKSRLVQEVRQPVRAKGGYFISGKFDQLHKYYLVEAERLRVVGKAGQAGQYYDQAIQLAKENQYLNEEALANELAGRCDLAQGRANLASFYLREAHALYQQWGALAKVKQLEKLYPQWLPPGRLTKTESGSRLPPALDLANSRLHKLFPVNLCSLSY